MSTSTPTGAQRGIFESSHWNVVAAEWVARRPQSLWRRHSDAVNGALLERWLPAERVGRLLKTDLFDEAVSDGLYRVLAARARHVIGIDVSHDVNAAARARYPRLGAIRSDVRTLPFADASFDLVTSISTLDHFRAEADVDRALREIARVLRANGTLIITVDNRDNPIIALRNRLPFALLNRVGLVPYFVGHTYGRSGLARALERNGFVVEETEAVMHAPRVVAVAVARLLDWMRAPMRGAMLGVLARCERLADWPTKYRTAHFVAIRATKRSDARGDAPADPVASCGRTAAVPESVGV